METVYTAYTKILEYKTYFFIKKFLVFPELKSVSPVLQQYGMHIDFDKACSIAGVTDIILKEQLLKQAQQANASNGKVIEISQAINASQCVAS